MAVAAARAAIHPDFPLGSLAAELRADRGGPDLDAFAHGDMGTDVRSVLSWSRRGLTEAADRLFRLLGLPAGPDLRAEALASLAGRGVDEVRSPLRELATAHLVTEHLPGRYACHDLLRAYADELGPPDGSDGGVPPGVASSTTTCTPPSAPTGCCGRTAIRCRRRRRRRG